MAAARQTAAQRAAGMPCSSAHTATARWLFPWALIAIIAQKVGVGGSNAADRIARKEVEDGKLPAEFVARGKAERELSGVQKHNRPERCEASRAVVQGNVRRSNLSPRALARRRNYFFLPFFGAFFFAFFAGFAFFLAIGSPLGYGYNALTSARVVQRYAGRIHNATNLFACAKKK